MIYRNATELIDFLKTHHLWNKKKLGQNFLVNFQVLEKICAAAELSEKDYVVEVGTGLGILTEQLAKKTHQVTTIEYDQTLIPILQNELKKYPNVELIHQDALAYELARTPYKLVANIPYYITSPLLNHFLQPQKSRQQRPALIVLLVQKEVAEKICALEGEHSILSLQVQIFGKPKIMGTVSKSSFFPQPKVDSAIIKITPYAQPLIANTKLFFKLIKAAFSQKRKTLLNSLQTGLDLSKTKIENLLQRSGIAANRRPQTLTLEEWGKLVKNYEAF